MPMKYHRRSDRSRGFYKLVVAIWVIAALSACAANVSFKPGVQGDAIAKDERECRVASSGA